MECIFCLENNDDTFIFSHSCGNYSVHRKCLDQWFHHNPNTCFVCRKNFFTWKKLSAFILFGNKYLIFYSPVRDNSTPISIDHIAFFFITIYLLFIVFFLFHPRPTSLITQIPN